MSERRIFSWLAYLAGCDAERIKVPVFWARQFCFDTKEAVLI